MDTDPEYGFGSRGENECGSMFIFLDDRVNGQLSTGSCWFNTIFSLNKSHIPSRISVCDDAGGYGGWPACFSGRWWVWMRGWAALLPAPHSSPCSLLQCKKSGLNLFKHGKNIS